MIKQIGLTILLTALLSGCEESKKQRVNNAIIEFEKDTIDFGTVTTATEAVKDIRITNAGTDTLYIYKVAASCGCTVPQLKDTVLAAGQSTIMKVLYKPGKKDTGSFSKSIVIKTNCKEPFKLIRIVGKTKPEKL